MPDLHSSGMIEDQAALEKLRRAIDCLHSQLDEHTLVGAESPRITFDSVIDCLRRVQHAYRCIHKQERLDVSLAQALADCLEKLLQRPLEHVVPFAKECCIFIPFVTRKLTLKGAEWAKQLGQPLLECLAHEEAYGDAYRALCAVVSHCYDHQGSLLNTVLGQLSQPLHPTLRKQLHSLLKVIVERWPASCLEAHMPSVCERVAVDLSCNEIGSRQAAVSNLLLLLRRWQKEGQQLWRKLSKERQIALIQAHPGVESLLPPSVSKGLHNSMTRKRAVRRRQASSSEGPVRASGELDTEEEQPVEDSQRRLQDFAQWKAQRGAINDILQPSVWELSSEDGSNASSIKDDAGRTLTSTKAEQLRQRKRNMMSPTIKAMLLHEGTRSGVLVQSSEADFRTACDQVKARRLDLEGEEAEERKLHPAGNLKGSTKASKAIVADHREPTLLAGGRSEEPDVLDYSEDEENIPYLSNTDIAQKASSSRIGGGELSAAAKQVSFSAQHAIIGGSPYQPSHGSLGSSASDTPSLIVEEIRGLCTQDLSAQPHDDSVLQFSLPTGGVLAEIAEEDEGPMSNEAPGADRGYIGVLDPQAAFQTVKGSAVDDSQHDQAVTERQAKVTRRHRVLRLWAGLLTIISVLAGVSVNVSRCSADFKLQGVFHQMPSVFLKRLKHVTHFVSHTRPRSTSSSTALSPHRTKLDVVPETALSQHKPTGRTAVSGQTAKTCTPPSGKQKLPHAAVRRQCRAALSVSPIRRKIGYGFGQSIRSLKRKGVNLVRILLNQKTIAIGLIVGLYIIEAL